MDILLPRQDGFEVLAGMRDFESLRQTRVPFVNDGDVTADQSARAMALGAIGMGTTPPAAEQLVSPIAKFDSP